MPSKPFAGFLIARLLRQIPDLPSITVRAMAETERPFCGDDWYWTDDNAKILELLSLPEIWRSYPDEVADVLKFLLSMFEGPLIYRRVARPRFDANGENAFTHSFMDIMPDAAKGLVSLGMRFHDGRTAQNVTLTGNYVRFKYQDKVHTSDIENSIFKSGIETLEGGIKAWWKSRLEVDHGFLNRQRKRIGDITYTFRVIARSVLFDISAELKIDPGVTISDVVLSFGYDNLSHNEKNIRYEAVAISRSGQPPQIVEAQANKNFVIPSGGCDYWSVFQRSEVAGFAAGVHSIPVGDAILSALKVNCDEHGHLHWVVSEYTFPGVQKGRVVAAERKLITSGGLYQLAEHYRDLMRRHGVPGTSAVPTDFSISYDYGAEMHSLARCYRVLSGPDGLVADETMKQQLRRKLDELRKVYHENFQHGAGASVSDFLTISRLCRACLCGNGRSDQRSGLRLCLA